MSTTAGAPCRCGRPMYRSVDGTMRCTGSALYPDQCEPLEPHERAAVTALLSKIKEAS